MSAVATVSGARHAVPWDERTTVDTSNLEVRKLIILIHILKSIKSLDIKGPVSELALYYHGGGLVPLTMRAHLSAYLRYCVWPVLLLMD
jgi:hypothetical protein